MSHPASDPMSDVSRDVPPRRVLVVGATGQVGRVVTRMLVGHPGVEVVVGSRHPFEVAATLGLRGLRLDLADGVAARATIGELSPDVVVLCTEPADAGFHAAMVEARVPLVDISASLEQLRRAEGLDRRARELGTSILLSVGVAPGLTNHVAARVSADLGGARRLEVSLVLGSGEGHGPEALRWVLAAAGESQVAAPLAVELPGLGRRRLFPMPFPDQHTLRRTLAVPDVTTRMTLDSRLAAVALFGPTRTAWGRRVLTSPAVARWAQTFTERVRIGGDSFLVLAEGERGGVRARRWVAGRGQSETTGLIAARAALRVLSGEVPDGVRHYDQVPALLDDVEQALSGRCTFGRSSGPTGRR